VRKSSLLKYYRVNATSDEVVQNISYIYKPRPLTEMNTRNIFWEVKVAGAWGR